MNLLSLNLEVNVRSNTAHSGPTTQRSVEGYEGGSALIGMQETGTRERRTANERSQIV